MPIHFSTSVVMDVAVQGFVETSLDVIEAVVRSRRHRVNFNGFVPRYLILFALSLPNVIIFSIGIPYQNSSVVLILFQSQHSIALMSIIVHV